MGVLRDILRGLAGDSQPTTSASTKAVSLRTPLAEEWLAIEALGFFGRWTLSPNEEWLLAHGNIRDPGAQSWKSDDESGAVLLFHSGKLMHCEGGLCRPDMVCVSNVGSFAVYERGPADEFLGPRCRLRVFSAHGEQAFEWRPSAAVDLLALSQDACHLAVTTMAAPAESKHREDDNSVILIDLAHSTILWRQRIPVHRMSALVFDDAAQHVAVHTEGIPDPLRYTYAGDFLDAEVAARARVYAAEHSEYGYALLDLARTRVGDRSLDCLSEAETEEVASLVRQSLAKQMSDSQKAVAHRILGELAEALGNGAEALSEYRTALRLNSKIGLKRRVEALEARSAE